MDKQKVLTFFKDCTRKVDSESDVHFDLIANTILTMKMGPWGQEFFTKWLDKRKDKYLALKKMKKK